MNAIQQQHRTALYTPLATPKAVAVFAHFKESGLKIQICHHVPVEPPNHIQLVFLKGAFAWVRLLAGNRLECRFQKSTMMEYILQEYFGSGQFEVTQPTILPKSLAFQMDVSGLWIKKGLYPVTETAEELIITF
ncbi:MAG: hypothetical protein AAF960_21070 [Bacteroidota bacterium]